MKFLILAGGFATRLWPLSEHRAKPLLVVGGSTILGHILKSLKQVQDQDIIVLTNRKFEGDIKKELKKNGRKNSIIFQEDSTGEIQKLGALRALSLCIKSQCIDDDITILAGDNLLEGFDPTDLQCQAHTARLIVRKLPDLQEASKFGVVTLGEKEEVLEFQEKPENPKSPLVSTGFVAFSRSLIPFLHECAEKFPDNLGGLFVFLKSKGITITAKIHEGAWFDIGSFESYLEAHKSLQKEPQIFEKGAQVKNSELVGKVFLGENTIVEDSVLVDCLILGNGFIKGCRLSQCLIDESVHLENVDLNHKMIRRMTKLKGPNA